MFKFRDEDYPFKVKEPLNVLPAVYGSDMQNSAREQQQLPPSYDEVMAHSSYPTQQLARTDTDLPSYQHALTTRSIQSAV